MFKIAITLLVTTGFAQDKSWHEMIASGEREKHATTLQLAEAYSKHYKKQFPHADKEEIENSQEITSGEDLNNFQYYKYFIKEMKQYEDKAAQAIANLSPQAAHSDKDYKIFREFLLYSQDQPKLKDLITSTLAGDTSTDKKLLEAFLQDPNPKLRASFASDLWRELAAENYSPEKTFRHIELFMQNMNKDDLLKAVQNFNRDGFLSDSFNDCSPFFAITAHILAGEKNKGIQYSGFRIDKKLEELEADKKGGTSDLKPEELEQEIQTCKLAQTLIKLPDADMQNLISNSKFEKEFWAKFNLDSKQREWLHHTIKYLFNKRSSGSGAGVAPAVKK